MTRILHPFTWLCQQICDPAVASARSSRPAPDRLPRNPLTQGSAIPTPCTLHAGRKWPEVCRTCGPLPQSRARTCRLCLPAPTRWYTERIELQRERGRDRSIDSSSNDPPESHARGSEGTPSGLEGLWQVERAGGLLPPMVGVWKRIEGAQG